MPLEKDVLTTGEVAKICNVAPRTVSKWFDSGQLKGYRIPGSRDRRIPMDELHRFMRSHGIPIQGLTSGKTRVLIVDPDQEVVRTLKEVLSSQTTYDLATASTGFEAGLACERFKPHVVVMDVHMPDADGATIAQIIRSSESLQGTHLIAMSARLTDGQAYALRPAGFSGFLKKPFPVRQMVEAIERATNLAA